MAAYILWISHNVYEKTVPRLPHRPPRQRSSTFCRGVVSVRICPVECGAGYDPCPFRVRRVSSQKVSVLLDVARCRRSVNAEMCPHTLRVEAAEGSQETRRQDGPPVQRRCALAKVKGLHLLSHRVNGREN